MAKRKGQSFPLKKREVASMLELFFFYFLLLHYHSTTPKPIPIPISTRILPLILLQLAASRATCHRKAKPSHTKPNRAACCTAGAEFEITLVYIVLRLRLKYCIKFAGW